MAKRVGFTVIEVMVAFTILFVLIVFYMVLLQGFLVAENNDVFYTKGENLANMMAEDVSSLSLSVIDSLIKGASYPPLFYNQPIYPAKISNPPPNTSPFYFDYGTDYSNVYDSIRYDVNTNTYYLMDASYNLEKISKIMNVSSDIGTVNDPPPQPQLPPGFITPPNIVITPVLVTDTISNTAYWTWNITLLKEVFPRYFKRIIIIDRTPQVTDLKYKVYDVYTIIYWQLKSGQMKEITLKKTISYLVGQE